MTWVCEADRPRALLCPECRGRPRPSISVVSSSARDVARLDPSTTVCVPAGVPDVERCDPVDVHLGHLAEQSTKLLNCGPAFFHETMVQYAKR